MVNFVSKRRSLIAALGLCLALSACETVTEVAPKTDEPDTVLYTIAEGSHYSDKNSVRKRITSSLAFEVVFDESARYTTSAPNNQGDINKLYGLSDCGNTHHTNSARFGWRWYNNRLELLAYTYVNKKMSYELLATVPIGEAVRCELRMEEGQYRFKLGDKELTMPRACNGAAEGYQLYPYFGGDETAPHAITIKIKEL